jgi:capsular polysaccharide export protein
MRRILFLSNSPRVTRYFRTLAAQLPDFQCRVRRVGVRFGGVAAPPPEAVARIIDYGMRRKRARPHYGPLRLRVEQWLYGTAARAHYRHAAALIRDWQPQAVVVWGGNAVDVSAVVAATRDAGVPCWRLENGQLPATTQMDLQGVNAESSVPREPAFYAARGGEWQAQTASAVVPRAPRKGKQAASAVPLPTRYVFVPFQVMLDSQVLLHSPWITGMEQFFELLCAAQDAAGPQAPVLVIKEHPSCPRRYPALHAQAATRGGRVLFANGNATGDLIEGAAGVVTLNSSVGVESLLLGKPVLVLGNAVFDVEGVTTRARDVPGMAAWLAAVGAGTPPPAPLRGAFLAYLAQDYLLPDRHQAPGPAHIAAVRERLLRSLEAAP